MNGSILAGGLGRVMRSAVLRRWIYKKDLRTRLAFAEHIWRWLNRGLSNEQRYRLLNGMNRARGIDRYAMLDSASHARNYGFFRMIHEIREVPGEIVECGVGHGLSLSALVYATSYFGMDKAVYGFDSFDGFPMASEFDVGRRVRHPGERPDGWTDTCPEVISAIFDCDRASASSVRPSLLRKLDVTVKIVPGFFRETLGKSLPGRIAFLHVDCDMYESTKIVLDACLPRMSPDGIVIFDEYHDKRWPGARKAVDEACPERHLEVVYFPDNDRYGLRIPG